MNFLDTLIQVLCYPIDSTQRIFVLYLASSIAIALAVYLATGQYRNRSRRLLGAIGFLSYLFPAKIWRHRSTWVDLRYFVLHQLVRIWIYTNLLTAMTIRFHSIARGWLVWLTDGEPLTQLENGTVAIASYTLLTIVLADFVSFLMHWAQHKIPWLWEFHKVHHSAEVLNPFSNYREHPVDNLAYAVVNAASAGLMSALFYAVLGWVPPVFLILGLNGIMFGFNIAGYNLRHSHIWVRWPGPLSYLFGSPAHHQIHHSFHPSHINKNMAFIFPIWDILFGTYYLPKHPDDVQIGLGDGTESSYRGFISIYLLPFIRLFQSVFSFRSKTRTDIEGD